MEEKGKAAVMTDFEEPFKVREYPIPEVEKGAILVKMIASGVCGTDVHTWLGHTGGKTLDFPVILGHENVGEIIRLGEGIEKDWTGKHIKIGDRITWTTTIGNYCYECYNCTVAQIPHKCLNRKTYGAGISSEDYPHFTGGWAQYCYLYPNTAIFKLPKNLSTEALTITGCAAPTSTHAFERANTSPGDTIVIQGAGAVGLLSTVLARESASNKVIVVGGPKHRLEIAKAWGANHTINIEKHENPSERIKKVREHTPMGKGADLVIECTGVPDAFPEGMKMLRDGGTYVVVGQFMDAGPTQFHPYNITFKEITLKGSYSWGPRHSMRAVNLVTKLNKKYNFDKIVTEKYPLEEVTKAVEDTKDYTVDKAVIDPWK